MYCKNERSGDNVNGLYLWSNVSGGAGAADGIQNYANSRSGSARGIYNMADASAGFGDQDAYGIQNNAKPRGIGSGYGIKDFVWNYSPSGGSANYGYYGQVGGATNNYGVYTIADKNYFSGNVGIGTTDPGSYKLNVNSGNTYLGGTLTLTGELTKPNAWNIRPSANNSPNVVSIRGGTGDDDNTGRLEVYGGSDGGVAVRLEGNSWAGPGTSYVNSAYFAIGTTNPNYYTLYVNGETAINGSLYKPASWNIYSLTDATNYVTIHGAPGDYSPGCLDIRGAGDGAVSVHLVAGSAGGATSYIYNNLAVSTNSTSGYNFYVNGSAAFSTLAGTGNRAVYSNAAGGLTNTGPSDVRLKKNIVSISEKLDVLASLKELRGVYYNWNTSLERVKDLGEQREIGMIAQEVEKVLPEVVGANSDGYKTLDYPRLTGYLIEVCKAQQIEIDDLKARLDRIEARPQPSSRN
jgi:hypothetical protein